MRSPRFPTRTMLACAALSVATVAMAQPRPDLGKREFESKCAVCHGLDGKGKGP